eukprot:scaffold182555_cov17-Tisochrysis_lutea.AAC.1
MNRKEPEVRINMQVWCRCHQETLFKNTHLEHNFDCIVDFCSNQRAQDAMVRRCRLLGGEAVVSVLNKAELLSPALRNGNKKQPLLLRTSSVQKLKMHGF